MTFRSTNGRVLLRACAPEDADVLYGDLVGTRVTDTIVWDGPESLEEYRQGLRERGCLTRARALHLFTVVDTSTNGPIGTIDVRRASDGTWTTGLWIAERVQGRGLGTDAVEAITRYAVDELGLSTVEAHVFVGNEASRRVFEKNGYGLTETRPGAVTKRGRTIDEWVLVHRV